MLMGGSGKVVSGLRRVSKKDNKTAATASTTSLPSSEQSELPRTSICASPFDRLCILISKWTFIPDVHQAIDIKIRDLPVQAFDQIPVTFPEYNDYVVAWEPLLFEEIKANLLSNFCPKARTNIKSRPFQFSLAERRDKHSVLQTIETQFLSHSSDSSCSDGPSKLDVILISLKPMTKEVFSNNVTTTATDTTKQGKRSMAAMPAEKVSLSSSIVVVADSSPADVVTSYDDKFMLGVVTDFRHEFGSRVFQVKVLASKWDGIKGSIKSFSSSSGSMRGQQSSVNKNGTLRSYNMHYVVVDSIRSSWREFQAVHDLGANVPLLEEVLGHSREMDMCATPPPPLEPEEEEVEELLASIRDKSGASGAGTTSSCRAVTATTHNVSRAPIEQEVMAWRMHGVTDRFMSYLRKKYNPSQLHAIRTAATQQGFTLVQGPPGTGKTSTIIGMLNSIHIREYNRYYDLALSTVLGPVGQSCRESNNETAWLNLVARLSKAKPHILVVAPSNIAVDNIIERIMSDGFLDGNGGKYSPAMLRVGGGKTPRVQSVSLEDTVKAEEAVLFQRGNERAVLMEQLNGDVRRLITDIYALQSLLFNLKTAFDRHYPLPDHVEVRVSTTTAQPYWSNHATKENSYEPPVIVKLQDGASRARPKYSRVDQLPQYFSLTRQLATALDHLSGLSLKRSWLHAVMASSGSNPRGGGGDSNSNGSSGAKELLENSIIDSAQLLFTTLNSSGHPCMESTEFCVTVIDEAAQCIEPSVLIALRRGCRQCVMVGDQKQLSATTFSPSAKAAGFDKSLFERLVQSGHPYIMLDTQYRMAPAVSRFPSLEFYEGNLRNGSNVCAPTYLPVFIKPNRMIDDIDEEDSVDAAHTLSHDNDDSNSSPEAVAAPRALLNSFMFFDLQSSQETLPEGCTSSMSYSNREEVGLCVALVRTLREEANRLGVNTTSIGSIGVITPYNDQLNELRKAFVKVGLMAPPTSGQQASSGGAGAATEMGTSQQYLDIECNTVDGFQGREKDFILISAVRANDTAAIGFVSDPRRLNVALTRGRFGMFVVGHAETLSSNKHWGDLLHYSQTCEGYVQVGNAHCDLRRVLQQHDMYCRADRVQHRAEILRARQQQSSLDNSFTLTDSPQAHSAYDYTAQLLPSTSDVPSIESGSAMSALLSSYSTRAPAVLARADLRTAGCDADTGGVKTDGTYFASDSAVGWTSATAQNTGRLTVPPVKRKTVAGYSENNCKRKKTSTGTQQQQQQQRVMSLTVENVKDGLSTNGTTEFEEGEVDE